jgi:hypothetical protein
MWAGVYVCQRLSFAHIGQTPEGSGQGQNRTREIRLSGIVGGPAETWTMGVGLRPIGKPME